MLPVILAALSIAQQKAKAQDEQNKQLINNVSQNQNTNMPVQQPQQNNNSLGMLQDVFSIFNKK